MHLRPHHLLCIQKFTGHGYDADFTAHMQAVVSELAAHPRTAIQIAAGCDDLCGRCPHNRDGVCASLEKVEEMDRRVLQICRLSDGAAAPWEDLAGRARKQILETAAFETVCARCQWVSFCRSLARPDKNGKAERAGS